MQGLRPLFLSGTVVLRSKLRPAGTRKKQPSFLRLASRQGKPKKQLTPRFLLSQRKAPAGLSVAENIILTQTDLNLTHPSLQRVNVNNALVINVLHLSTVGAGFIPALPAALYLFCVLSAAARMGINPTPTVAECCKSLSISGLRRILNRGWGHPLIASKRHGAFSGAALPLCAMLSFAGATRTTPSSTYLYPPMARYYAACPLSADGHKGRPCNRVVPLVRRLLTAKKAAPETALCRALPQ